MRTSRYPMRVGMVDSNRRPHEFPDVVLAVRCGDVDAELSEDVAEVEVDGAGAEEELLGDLMLGQSLRDEAGDLELLAGELVDRARVASACTLAAGS
jgi:hypothetical protein